MAYDQDVKELAYTIDPPCWVSYSGKPRYFKAAMDERRHRALQQAQATIGRISRREKPTSVEERLAELESEIAELRACTHKSGTLMDLAMSALPSEADIRAGLQDVCFVPRHEIAAR